MPARPPKETNQLAKYILEVTTGETEKIEPPVKNPHAQALSALGQAKADRPERRTYRLKSEARSQRMPRTPVGVKASLSLLLVLWSSVFLSTSLCAALALGSLGADFLTLEW
jgi:hypothetical protein